MVATVSNPDGVTLFYSCPVAHLMYYRDGWQDSGPGGGCIDDPNPFTCIVAGDSIGTAFQLTNDFFPRAGWYRIEFYLYDAAFGAPLNRERRSSEPFYVGP